MEREQYRAPECAEIELVTDCLLENSPVGGDLLPVGWDS